MSIIKKVVVAFILISFSVGLSATPEKKWEFTTNGNINALLLISDGNLYFSSEGDEVYALTPSGDSRWTFKLKLSNNVAANLRKGIGDDNYRNIVINGHISRSLAASPNGEIYAGTYGGIFSISPKGKQNWLYSGDSADVFYPESIVLDLFLVYGG